MAKKTFKIRVFPAAKGIDQSSIPGTAPIDSLAECNDLIFTVNSSRKKRYGLNTYYRSGFGTIISKDMRGIIDFWRNVSSVQTQKTVVFAGTKVFSDSADGRFNDITGAASIGSEDMMTSDVFVGLLIMGFENSTHPYSYNQTGNIVELNGANVPHCPIWRQARRRMWGCGNKAAPHTLYYSPVEDPTFAGGAGGSISIDIGDSDPVGLTAIYPEYNGNIIVAKRKSMYRIQEIYSADLSATTFRVDAISKSIGCISNNSAVSTDNDIIFASERGIHSLNMTEKAGDVSSTFLSFPVHDYYKTTINFQKAKNIWAIYDPELNSYLFAFTRRGMRTNQDLLAYNVSLGQWYLWEDFDCAALCRSINSRARTRTLIGTESLNIGQLDEDLITDFGVSYGMSFSTPIIYPQQAPDIISDFKALTVLFKPQEDEDSTFTVAYKVDGQTIETLSFNQYGTGTAIIGTATIGSSLIGGGGVIKRMTMPLKGSGASIQLLFNQEPNSTTVGEDCEIYGYIIEGEYAEDSAISSVQ